MEFSPVPSGQLGLGHAAVAQNRRTVYTDGTAACTRKTSRPDFHMIEGYEDHNESSVCFSGMPTTN